MMQRLKKWGVLLGVVLFFVLLPLSNSYAFRGLDDIKSLSYDLSRPEEDVAKDLEQHSETPKGDPSLEMEFKLPAGWTAYEEKFNAGKLSAVGKDTDIFSPLVRYMSPPRLEWRSEFRVRSIEVNSLMSLKNWFALYSLQMGFSPEGVSVISENRIETQYTLFEGGEPMVIRSVIERSGNRILLAEYLVHQDNYEAERDLQILSMKSYRLVHPDESLPVRMGTYAFVDIAKFNYPLTWVLFAPDINSVERMEASIINVKGLQMDKGEDLKNSRLNGRIDVSVISKYLDTTLEKEVKLVGEDLKKNGLILKEKVATVKGIEVNEKILSTDISIYHIEPPEANLDEYQKSFGKRLQEKKLADYEYWFAILQTGGRFYLIRLLTIGRDEDFIAWAENTEAFRILVSSLSPVSADES